VRVCCALIRPIVNCAIECSFRLARSAADARRINSVLKIYGSYLVSAVSTGVYRVQPAGTGDTGYTNTCAVGEQDCPTGEQPNSDLSTCAVNATDVAVFPARPGNGLLIGQFKLKDGRTGAHPRSPPQNRSHRQRYLPV
jgi:hypothetical protein